jgi:tetratricopeptide (TPR) repeat protein
LGTFFAQGHAQEEVLRKDNNEGFSSLIRYYEEAIKANPDGKNLHFPFGLLLYDEGQLSAAKVQFSAELELNPEDYRARAMVGMVDVQQRRYSDGIQNLKTALANEPNLRQAYLPLGQALFHLGKLDEAVVTLKTASQLEPGQPETYSLLALIYSRLGRKEDAVKVSELDARARKRSLAESYASLGNWPEALRCITEYLAAFPRSSQGLYIEGAIYFDGFRQVDKAIAVLQQAVVADSLNVKARQLLAIMHWIAGKSPEAEREMSLLLAADSTDGMTQYYYGRFLLEHGRFREASQHLEFARRLRPTDELVASNLAVVYESLGLSKEAEKQHLEAISLADKREVRAPPVYENYGAYLLDHGRTTEAIKILNRALTVQKPSPRGFYLAGMAYALDGQRNEAVKYLKRAVELNPDYRDARVALAALSNRDGEPEGAKTQRVDPKPEN